MDWQLAQQLQTTILIANSTSVNMYGEKQYGAATSHKGRQIGSQKWAKGKDGQSLLSYNQVVLTSTVTVNYDSLIWLQGESTSSYSGHPVLSLNTAYDETGAVDHYKVYL